jgi:hypothetical protein
MVARELARSLQAAGTLYLAPHPFSNLQQLPVTWRHRQFRTTRSGLQRLRTAHVEPARFRISSHENPTTTHHRNKTSHLHRNSKQADEYDKLAPPTLRPNLGKSQREYIKQRAEQIRGSPSFVPNDAYPQSAWKLVAWWNTCFGTAGFPEPTTVQAEIARQHPREFNFLEYSIPTTLLNNAGNRRGNTGSAHRTNTESQAPSGAAATKTLAERITHPTTQHTLAERITFPDDPRTANLASRITYPAGHPSSLESRITFPKRPDDRHRIRKRGRKDAAPGRN